LLLFALTLLTYVQTSTVLRSTSKSVSTAVQLLLESSVKLVDFIGEESMRDLSLIAAVQRRCLLQDLWGHSERRVSHDVDW